MPVHSLIHSLGSIGVFPSRAFLPAFVAALLMRFGDSMPVVAQAGLAGTVHAPSWFTCNTSLVVLGILSCLECWATKSSDVRELLDQFFGHPKALQLGRGRVGGLRRDHARRVSAVDDITDGGRFIPAATKRKIFWPQSRFPP